MHRTAVEESDDDVETVCYFFFFQAEDGIRDLVRSRGLGDVYKRQQLDDLQWVPKFQGRQLQVQT